METFEQLSENEIDRIVEMAWEDRTPFDAIEKQFGIPESQVIKIMRKSMKESSFKMWRARVQGRKTKHAQKVTDDGVDRFKSKMQHGITLNKMSKR